MRETNIDIENKLIWLADDFRYLGQKVVQLDDPVHMVTKITKTEISDKVISIITEPQDFYYPEKPFSYSIRLELSDGGIFRGKWQQLEDAERYADLRCERYDNPTHTLLMGAWDVEEDEYYFEYFFWMAKIKK